MKTNKSKIQNKLKNKLKVSITKIHRTANLGKLQHTISCHNIRSNVIMETGFPSQAHLVFL